MEKHPELYVTILRLVGQTMRLNDMRNTVTLAWMVVGLLMSRTVHLGKWGLERTSQAVAASRERQIARWLHNPKIKVEAVYREFATAALLPWAGQTAVLALDSSVLWEKYVIVRVGSIRNFVCEAQFPLRPLAGHVHAPALWKRSSKRMANWLMACFHSLGGIVHF